MHFKALPAFLLALLLASCSMSDDVALAEAEVPRFHQLLDSLQFEQIYDKSADEMKTAATKADLVSLLEAINRKLGAVFSSTKTSWHVNYHISGTFVTLAYETVFEHGKGVEQFVYKVSDKQPRLVGYHINSNELITR